MKIRIFLGVIAAVVIGWTSSNGQEREFYKKPTNTPEFWKAIQFEISVGKYEIAAGLIKGLLELNPTDKDLLDLEQKHGLVAFLKLRNVEKWSPDRATDLAAREDVEKLIGMVSAALKKELSNPERITKFARNLTAPTPEESAFAIKELLRSGIDAIPILLSLAQTTPDTFLRAAILDVLPLFELSAVPPIVAALDVADAKFKSDLLDSLLKRRDLVALGSRPDTDIIPMMWYTMAPLPQNSELLRQKALHVLQVLLGRDPMNTREKERTLPQWNLTEIARRFYEHKARFSTKDRTTIWRWDGKQLVNEEKSITDAEEYYGMRYLKWALQIQPDFVEAQRLFINFALERHFQRAGVDLPLSRSAPGLNAIVATLPYSLLTELLEAALRDNRVPTALVMIQAIADRAELKSARPSPRTPEACDKPEFRPALLMKGLDYPDRRIQFAAADAILRMPGPPTHQRTAQIVKILKAAISSEPDEKDSKPKAMIGDPDRVRGQSTAQLLRRMGYDVEIAVTGRDLVRRMQTKPDFELLVVDPHLPYPLFPEFLAQARADIRVGAVPMIVVATGEEPSTAHPITLLARLAVIVAAQEHEEEIFAQKRLGDSNPLRDSPARRFNERLDKLKKLVESVGINVTPEVLDRLEYYTLLAAPDVELDLPPDAVRSRLVLPPDNRRARLAVLRSRVVPNQLFFINQKELTGKLANLAAKIENDMAPDIQQLARIYWKVITEGQFTKQGRVIQEPLPAIVLHNPEVEARLKYLTRTYKHVKVIPEVFTEQTLKEELDGFVHFQDPKSLEMAKRTNAQIAIDWLRKMAVGEIEGYPYIDAEAALRKALRSKDLAPQAIEAVAKLSSKEAQQDLASVVLANSEDNPPANRIAAADALIKHIQLRGNLLSQPQIQLLTDLANTEANADLKGKLISLQGIFSANAKSTGAKLLEYIPAAPMPKEPKEPEKKEEEKKDKE